MAKISNGWRMAIASIGSGDRQRHRRETVFTQGSDLAPDDPVARAANGHVAEP